jgi:hypothetical protein
MPDDDHSIGPDAGPARANPKTAASEIDGEAAVLAAIAAMPNPDRAICERLHTIIKASVPTLSPKLWYTMPAYAFKGKVICFFRQSHTRPAKGVRHPWEP